MAKCPVMADEQMPALSGGRTRGGVLGTPSPHRRATLHVHQASSQSLLLQTAPNCCVGLVILVTGLGWGTLFPSSLG